MYRVGKDKQNLGLKVKRLKLNIFPIISMANSVKGNLIYSPIGLLMKGQERKCI